MRKIMILGAGVYQVPLIKKAKEMGLYVIVVSYKGNYPGFRFADKVYYEDAKDYSTILKIAKDENINGICTTGTDLPVVTIGKLVDELGVNGVTYEAALYGTNKLKMKKQFIENNVRTAKYEEVCTIDETLEVFKQLEKPVIFKAVDSSGSRGILKVDNEDMVEKAFNEVKRVTRQDYFIIEEFIEGIEFGAQAFVYDSKLQFVLPHGDILFTGDTAVPIGHYAPYELSDEVIKDTEQQVKNCIEALKIDNCAINADFILKDDKVYVLEIGARAGATCLPELVSLSYGFDYYEQIINVALKEKPKFTYDLVQPNASILLASEKDGEIVSIKNNNKDDKNIVDISFDYSIGDKVKNFWVGPDRIGQIIVKGENINSTLEFLNEVKDNIHIEVE